MDWPAFAAATGAGRGVLAVAPHPDDETLGCGGLLALAARAGAPVAVAYVTDGAASHPGSREWSPGRLAALRRAEARRACHVLGVVRPPLHLGLPDGGTPGLGAAARAEAVATLARLVRSRRPGLVVTTWAGEPHCDHQFAYHLARKATRGTNARLAAYAVWTGLLGPAHDLPGVPPLRLDVAPVLAAKRRALAAHRSQLGQVVRDDPDGFTLSPRHREAMLTPTERYWLQ